MKYTDEIARLLKNNMKSAIDVLTNAFWDDPLNLYFFPEEEKRKRFLPLFFEFRLKQGMRYGNVHVTSPDIVGVAIWIHSKTIESTLWRLLRSGGLKLYRAYGGALVSKMRKVDEFSTERRRRLAVTPYIHLGSFAVDPKHQGRGYASKLIRPMLQHLDEMRMHSYLETQDESNISLYQHYGFEVLEKGIVPDVGILHWDMMRTPQI
ncbi:MAG: GNAT family N-acetyltransferase [Candidatus Thorarchaeota archaeon]|jgi:ribosomal protein S18 acetylase RimI-like enzyme